MKTRSWPCKLLFAVIVFCTLLSGCLTTSYNIPGVSRDESLVLFGSAPSTLDPAVARTSDVIEYIVEIFSGLVCFNAELQLSPDIAEKWERNADGTVYTFHLRPEARFHNGKQVTAQDFKYSLERACDPATRSQTAETYLGDIVGVKERLLGLAEEVSGIKVIDNHTLQLTIDAPKEYFLSKLAYPTAFVVDRSNVESGVNWWKNPNGTGPFKLKSWDDDNIILERNDDYYFEPAKVKNVVFRLWGGAPITLYENDYIDVSPVYQTDIERVLDPANPLNQELRIVPEFTLSYIGFNATKPPFDDPKVRQAFSHAIDKDKIVRLVLKDMAEKADGILPPGMPGYNENLQGLSFDPELARRLIAESKYSDVSNLPPITLTSSGLGVASPVEAALVDMWRNNLGVEVVIRQLDPGNYFSVLMEKKDEMFVAGWGADYPDPQNFLDILFHSGTEDNLGEYSNPEVDALLEKARVEQDSTKRVSMYQEIEQLLVDDAACLPLYFSVSFTLVKPYVRGLLLAPLWLPRLRYVWIEPH
jgi:oligopeptide transport system substrate-binding protein